MQVFAHWSLPAVVLISGFGALVMCALLLRDWYPSSSATNSDAEPSGDAGLTRLGHAFAATCFALIAVIGVIGLVQQGRAVRQAQAEQDGVATKIAEVREEVLGLDKRVARDRKSTRLNSSHDQTSYAVFCLKKKRSRPSSLIAP